MAEVMYVLHREFVYLWYYFDVQLRQIFGYWVLGILLGSCVSVFLKDRIHGVLRSMRRSRMGLWGIVPASLLGIASPLCMYGSIPLAASFSRSGMRDEWLASFMMCSILLWLMARNMPWILSFRKTDMQDPSKIPNIQ